MAVMGVTDVRMGVLQLPVAMLMGMPEGLIAGDPFDILRSMAVFVMGIATDRFMAMAMGMAQCLMAMPVAVLLP